MLLRRTTHAIKVSSLRVANWCKSDNQRENRRSAESYKFMRHLSLVDFRVHGELKLKLLRVGGVALGSESGNGSYSMWFAVWDYLQLHLPAYHCQMRYGCDIGCSSLGSLRVFSSSQPHSRIVFGQEIRGK